MVFIRLTHQPLKMGCFPQPISDLHPEETKFILIIIHSSGGVELTKEKSLTTLLGFALPLVSALKPLIFTPSVN